MRKIALLAVVAFAAACGSSSDPAPTGSTITGTVGTTAFTSASQLALVASGNACTIPQAPGIALGVSLALLDVSDAAGTCTSACVPTSRSLGLVIAKVHVPTTQFPSTDAPPFTTGAYQFADLTNLAGITPDASGNIAIFTGGLATLGAAPACDPLVGGGYFIGTGSTMTVSTVSGSTLTGTLNINLFSSSTGLAAGSLTGGFTTATNCTPSPAPSACDLLNGILTQLP